jgi:chromosome segregation ATPase
MSQNAREAEMSDRISKLAEYHRDLLSGAPDWAIEQVSKETLDLELALTKARQDNIAYTGEIGELRARVSELEKENKRLERIFEKCAKNPTVFFRWENLQHTDKEVKEASK